MTTGEQGVAVDTTYVSSTPMGDDTGMSARAVGTDDVVTTPRAAPVMRDIDDENSHARIYDQNR